MKISDKLFIDRRNPSPRTFFRASTTHLWQSDYFHITNTVFSINLHVNVNGTVVKCTSQSDKNDFFCSSKLYYELYLMSGSF